MITAVLLLVISYFSRRHLLYKRRLFYARQSGARTIRDGMFVGFRMCSTPITAATLLLSIWSKLQELFRTFLKQIGFSRVVVGTAKDAIKSLRKQKFDLLFLDLQLPDAPGDQVYQTAKQIDPDINVIVITGYADSEILDRILQVCPVTVLKKPLKIEQLYQTVKILGHSGPSWGSKQQSSRLLVGL